MADSDVPITAGTGTKIDTRTVGPGVDEHRQVVVIGDPTTAANVTSVSANGDAYSLIHRDLIKISVQSAGLTNVTYAAGDQVGNLFTITNAARVAGGSGNIVGVVLVDAQDVIGPMDVVFFDASVTLAADNAVFSISDPDALNISALVQLAGAVDIGGNRIATAQNLSIPFVCGAGSQNIYAALITRFANSGFPSAGLLQLIVYIERN